jgi:hypothetical protein
MASSGMLRYVALVRTDVSVERSVTIIGVTRIGELGTMRLNSTHTILTERVAFVSLNHGSLLSAP